MWKEERKEKLREFNNKRNIDKEIFEIIFQKIQLV